MPFALLVVILGIALLSPPLSAQPAPRVRVEPSGNVTVQARNVPLSVVLARLAAEGVEVVVPELPADRPVTISLENRPVRDVLAQLLPSGTRYWIRGGKDDRTVSGSTGDKPGRRTERPANLPKKDARITLPPLNPDGGRKPPADERLPKPKRVPGMKEPPTIREGSDDRQGPKIPRRIEEKGRYVRLRLTMTKERIRVDDALVLDGELVPERRLAGDFVWALETSAGVVAVGSFVDPLELHSFFPDPKEPHAVLRAESGDFHVSLPSSVLERGLLAGSRLVVYRVIGQPPTQELTPETFPKFREVLREQYTLGGDELYRRLEQQQ